MLAVLCQIEGPMTMRLTTKDGAVRFEVHAKPRAKKSRIAEIREGAAVVALAAPPVDGAANEELVRLLARVLEIPKRSVEIVRGETSQKKLVAVHGLTEGEVRERLDPA